MNPSRPVSKLAKGSYFLVLDNLTNLGIGAIFWLILAKLADPTVIGQAMVVSTFAITVIGFTGHGIQVALSKYMSEYSAKNMPNTVRRVLKNGIRASLAISGIIALVISLLSGYISTVAYQEPALTLLIVFTITTFLPTQTVIASLIGAFNGLQIMKYVTLTDLIFQISRMAFAVFALVYGLGVFGILLGFSIASFVSLAVCLLYLLPRAIPKSADHEENPKEGRKNIVYFTGLNYVTVGFGMLSHQLGILVLGMYSFETAAFYGLALLISKVVGSFSHSVGGALLPTASEEWVKGNKSELQKMVNTAIRVSIMISGFGFIILMIEPEYFLSLISEPYAGAAMSLKILATSAVITAITSILTSLQNAANRASDVAKIGIASSVISVVLTIALASVFGMEGAAIALLIGSAFRLGLSLVMLRQNEKMVISSYSIVKPFIAILSGLLVGYIFVFLGHVLVGAIFAVTSYLVFSIVYKVTSRHEIRQIIGVAISRTLKQ